MNNIFLSFLITFLAGLATLLGTLLIFLKHKNHAKIITCSLAFAAGVMTCVSIFDLLVSSFNLIIDKYFLIFTLSLIIVFILIGIGVSIIINRHVNELENNKNINNYLYKVGVVSLIGLFIHNVFEGIATFITSSNDINLGISLAVSIACHNIPEGISISIPIYYATKSKIKAFKMTSFSAFAEFLGAIIAYFILTPLMSNVILGLIYSIIAGLMLHIAICELIPASLKYKDYSSTMWWFFIGIFFMLLKYFF